MTALPVPTLSARVVSGKRTNRVKVQRVRRPRRVAETRYRLDRSVRGKGHVHRQISMPPDELRALDAFAERVQMARSHVVRQAVKHFMAKVEP